MIHDDDDDDGDDAGLVLAVAPLVAQHDLGELWAYPECPEVGRAADLFGEVWRRLPPSASAVLRFAWGGGRVRLRVRLLSELAAPPGAQSQYTLATCRPALGRIDLNWPRARVLNDSLLEALLAHETAHGVLYVGAFLVHDPRDPASVRRLSESWVCEAAADQLAAAWGFAVGLLNAAVPRSAPGGA
jgi:hypothetical protein